MKVLKFISATLIVAFVVCGMNLIPHAAAAPEPDPEPGLLDRLNNIVERGKDMMLAIPHLTVRIGKNILSFIPTPEAIFNLNKQFLIGVPVEIVANAIHRVCTAAVALDATKPLRPLHEPNEELMNFEFVTQDNDNITVPFDNLELLYNHPKFHKDWNVTLLITGWNSDITEMNDATETLYAAYRLRDINFVVLDAADYVNTLYIWSSFNTDAVGYKVGKALVALTKYVDASRLHLIGHSLGAHMVGIAGRTFTKLTGQRIPRITGLDPARPCFGGGERLDGLRRGDADYVDVIHTNPGVLGIKPTIGDADFYPNGQWTLQPGCWGVICSHMRSYEYFAETVIPHNERNILCVRCSSYSSYTAGRCNSAPIPMGFAVPTTEKGEYYCKTNSNSPYGKSTSLVQNYAAADTIAVSMEQREHHNVLEQTREHHNVLEQTREHHNVLDETRETSDERNEIRKLDLGS